MYHYIFFINLVLKYIYIYRYTYICRSVGLSVCRSVGLSVCRSVCYRDLLDILLFSSRAGRGGSSRPSFLHGKESEEKITAMTANDNESLIGGRGQHVEGTEGQIIRVCGG